KAVVWMDVMQMAVYIAGAFFAVFLLIEGLPHGLSGTIQSLHHLGKFQIINFGFDMSFRDFIAQPYTLITAVIGGAVFSLASHGTDQLMVQRLLTTRNLKDGKKALIASGFVVCL